MINMSGGLQEAETAYSAGAPEFIKKTISQKEHPRNRVRVVRLQIPKYGILELICSVQFLWYQRINLMLFLAQVNLGHTKENFDRNCA